MEAEEFAYIQIKIRNNTVMYPLQNSVLREVARCCKKIILNYAHIMFLNTKVLETWWQPYSNNYA